MTSTPATRRRPTPRRAFTLIEILMAATLGVIVASACIGLFAAIQRADAKSKERTASIQAMSRLHRTLQRTMRTVLLDLPKSRPAGSTDPLDPPSTRVSLSETSDGMQRLEVTLSQPPILGLVGGKPIDPITRYQPVRGIFEMRRPTTAASLRTGKAAPIELWWTPYEVGTENPKTEAQVKVADSINDLQFRFAKTNEQKQLEKMKTASFADWSQIPAYVEVQVTTIDGNNAQWMFEVSGSTGMQPGENQADADLPAAVAQRFRGVLAARTTSSEDGGRGEASSGTNSSSASNGTSKPSSSSGGLSGNGASSGISGSSGGSSSGSGSGSASSGNSGSGGNTGSGGTAGGGTNTNPMANMTIGELMNEFYRRLAQRDGYTYNPNPYQGDDEEQP